MFEDIGKAIKYLRKVARFSSRLRSGEFAENNNQIADWLQELADIKSSGEKLRPSDVITLLTTLKKGLESMPEDVAMNSYFSVVSSAGKTLIATAKEWEREE